MNFGIIFLWYKALFSFVDIGFSDWSYKPNHPVWVFRPREKLSSQCLATAILAIQWPDWLGICLLFGGKEVKARTKEALPPIMAMKEMSRKEGAKSHGEEGKLHKELFLKLPANNFTANIQPQPCLKLACVQPSAGLIEDKKGGNCEH